MRIYLHYCTTSFSIGIYIFILILLHKHNMLFELVLSFPKFSQPFSLSLFSSLLCLDIYSTILPSNFSKSLFQDANNRCLILNFILGNRKLRTKRNLLTLFPIILHQIQATLWSNLILGYLFWTLPIDNVWRYFHSPWTKYLHPFDFMLLPSFYQ